MRQAEIIISMVQGELLPHAVLALASGADPSSHCGHMLADGEVDPLDEGGIDLPASRRQHLIDRLQSPEHHAMRHGHQTPAAHGLHHLRIA
jgi:hypothetical protein